MREFGERTDESGESVNDAERGYRSESPDSLRRRLFGERSSERSESPTGVERSPREVREGERLEDHPELAERVRLGVDEVRAGLERWDANDRARAEEWFGSSDARVRRRLTKVFDRIDAKQSEVRFREFSADMTEDERETTYAYVEPRAHRRGGEYDVHVGSVFNEADGPPNSRAGIVVHEMSHFRDIGRTGDVRQAYGVNGSRRLAAARPRRAVRTADNVEFFFEEYERDVLRRQNDAR